MAKNGGTLSRGFGLMSFRRPERSICQLVISTWAEILCPVKFNKAGPWGGRGEEAEGGEEDKI